MTYLEVVDNWVRRTRAEAARRERVRSLRRMMVTVTLVCGSVWGAVAWAVWS